MRMIDKRIPRKWIHEENRQRLQASVTSRLPLLAVPNDEEFLAHKCCFCGDVFVMLKWGLHQHSQMFHSRKLKRLGWDFTKNVLPHPNPELDEVTFDTEDLIEAHMFENL
jgi:hypothetical protein